MALVLRKKPSRTTSKGLERAHEILEAARELFVAEGYAGFSMRRVAARSGITLGTVQHYYPTQELLLAAMLARMLEAIQRGADRVVKAATGSAAARFCGAMRFYVGWLREPANQATFSELKALAIREPAAARAFAAVATHAHTSIARHIHELVPDARPAVIAKRATLVLAALMGHTYFDRVEHRTDHRDAAMIEHMLRTARS